MKTIAFFNNKGGVGKTSLVYHLSSMYADLGLNVVAADLDPQANLTSMFLEDERLEALWADGGHKQTIYGAFQPLLDGTGDVAAPHIEDVAPGLSLVAGDLTLSAAEEELSGQWPDCLDRKPRAFRVLSGMWRILMAAGKDVGADLVLIDVGPGRRRRCGHPAGPGSVFPARAAQSWAYPAPLARGVERAAGSPS